MIIKKGKMKVKRNEKSDPINTIIEKYYELSQQEKEIKKQKDELNKTIKEQIEVGEKKVNDIIITKSIQERTTINEDKLLEILKNNFDIKDLKYCGSVQTKEYINMEILEDNIQNGDINLTLLKDAQEVKEVVVLNIKKIQRKEV